MAKFYFWDISMDEYLRCNFCNINFLTNGSFIFNSLLSSNCNQWRMSFGNFKYGNDNRESNFGWGYCKFNSNNLFWKHTKCLNIIRKCWNNSMAICFIIDWTMDKHYRRDFYDFSSRSININNVLSSSGYKWSMSFGNIYKSYNYCKCITNNNRFVKRLCKFYYSINRKRYCCYNKSLGIF